MIHTACPHTRPLATNKTPRSLNHATNPPLLTVATFRVGHTPLLLATLRFFSHASPPRSLDDLACRPPFLDGREVEGGSLPSLPSSVAPLPRRGHGTVGAVAMERSRHTDMPVREVDAQYVMPWPLWYPLYTCKTACVQGVLVGRWCTQGAMLAMDTSGERAP
jgi:hypothetical protein